MRTKHRVQRAPSSSSRGYMNAQTNARHPHSPANAMEGATEADVLEDEADGISPPCTCDRPLSVKNELDGGVRHLSDPKLAKPSIIEPA